MSDPIHVPVMPDEVLTLLDPRPGEIVLDCTLGQGGHAARITPRLAPGGRYVGLDADPASLDAARRALADAPVTLDLVHVNFRHARAALDELGVGRVDGLIADLGFASSQMDDASRGLSFQREGPLDMRLDPTLDTTAADLVNQLPERDLADVIYRYGDERLSRRIARKIVDARRNKPIRDTRELAALCASAYPRGRHQRIDPATRTFQALRIAVNDELGALDALLESLPELMSPGGRAVFISFHSLEDRRVKQTFREWVRDDRAEALTKKPMTPTAREIADNPRSRSAKTRGIRWLNGSIERES
ncbi:MAG: 16S rRNA (cytosine(1402)-N(4))-methyltransferase RsmH [Phycisphaera sp.]|nr:16S rRNA (cytosine(1402)-N(4))-methyltransferase RsmH [Phycisphaera sp.]